MRQALIAATMTLAVSAGAIPAHAQMDRYGGQGSYAAPMPQPSASRVLSWPGKAVPPQSPPQAGGYGYPRYVQAQPAYGAQLQPAPYAQSRGAPPAPYAVERRAAMYPQPQPAYAYPQPPAYPQQVQPQQQQARPQAAYPSPYQAQPYYAPAPMAPPNAPGSTATAPTGVYPANTVPPQLAYPMAVPPQAAQPLVNNAAPAPPTSIYAPPPQAQTSQSQTGQGQSDPTDPRQPQRVAMNTAPAPVQTARLYSLHRQFGLQPDPTPTPAPDEERQTVELVSSIDSGVGGEPQAEPRNRVIQTKGRTTAVLRSASNADPDAN